MNEQERFVFDTQGCLLIEDVLTREETEHMVNGFPRDEEGNISVALGTNSYHNPLTLDEPLFRELINHPGVMPYLEALLTKPGDDSPGGDRFFLAHEYSMHLKKGVLGPSFHNGGTPFDPWYSYSVHQGKIYCGLLTVVWFLTDAAEGDGGFWYIPGSHQANFPMPQGLIDYKWVPDCAVQPPVRAGSAMLFTEALVHGTRPWTAEHERHVLFYKYLPGYMALGKDKIEQRVEKLNAEQLRYVDLSDMRQ